ncbi:MAG: DUF167 domain-containing protein [Candidatus Omnitrophota bacterium]
MQIDIKVIAGAKKNLIKKEHDGFKVYCTAPAQDGKANKLVCELLAQEFHVPKSRIEMIKGLKSRRKTIKIIEI